MDYKKTLLIPNTNFEMRGNLPQKDITFLEFWNKKNLYEKINIINKNGDLFILHDGPPYANGDLHMGHALNKILKDIIIRYQLLNGKSIDFRPGWDTHGLPIEIAIQKKFTNLKNLSKTDYLKICEDYAFSQVENQQEQFKSFGLVADFSNRYLTLENDYVSKEIEIFYKMLNKKLIYQDLKPVYWSWSSKTALAEAEIEYKNVKEDSIFVKFYDKEKKIIFLIWTTTPWTLPANVAIAVNKNINYCSFFYKNEKIIIAKNLLSKIEDLLKTKFTNIIDVNIKKFIGKKLINPINNNESLIVYGHHVSDDNGTGIVHVAGGHGIDDYLIVKKNNLPLFIVIDDDGKMINTNKYDNIFYQKANKLIIEDLKDSNNLFFLNSITHSIPIDWRTKKPVVYRATKQWFFSINSISKKLVHKLNDVNFYPKWGKDKLIQMIENRSDWCISRQRLWGVPIPIIYDENNKPIINIDLQKNIINAFKKDGIFSWYNLSIKELLPNNIYYHEKMRKETDILDVWFDSGASNYVLFDKEKADIYFEGTDQFRGWFNSSLILSYIAKKDAPYKNVLVHGFITDDKGNKMSKSIGNVKNPIDIVKRFGLDILRLWVTSSDYFSNVKISDKIINQNINDYRKIRNTIKFLLANISDFDYEYIPHNRHFTLIDKMILIHVQDLQTKIELDYSNYNFAKILKVIIGDITSRGIAYYLDYVKDIIYIEKKDSKLRRASQYVLNYIYLFLIKYLAPILPVTIEESFQIYKNNNDISVFLFRNWNKKINFSIKFLWNDFNLIRNLINKEIEKMRKENLIKTSSQLEVIIQLNQKYFNLFNNLISANDLMLGKLSLIINEKLLDKEMEIEVKKIGNTLKCQRCWKWYLKDDMQNKEICKRCNKIIN